MGNAGSPFSGKEGDGGNSVKAIRPKPWPGLARPQDSYLGEPLPSACCSGHCWVTAGGTFNSHFKSSEESTFSFRSSRWEARQGCTLSGSQHRSLVPARRPRCSVWGDRRAHWPLNGSVPMAAHSPQAGGAEGFGNY